jgi:predicted nucleotidyltransferase
MTRDDAIAALKALEPEARALGVTGLYLFGSTARGEAGPGSDVDVFFDYDTSRVRGFAVFDIADFISSVLPARADAIARRNLHPRIVEDVMREAVRVF